MYSKDLKQLAEQYPMMNFISTDENGFVYLSQYEPRFWGFTEKSKKWMACNIKCLYGVSFDGFWKESKKVIKLDISEKYYLPKGNK